MKSKTYFSYNNNIIVFDGVVYTEWVDTDTKLLVHLYNGVTIIRLGHDEGDRFQSEFLAWLEEDEPSIDDLLEVDD